MVTHKKQNKLLRSLGIDPQRTIYRDSFKDMPLEQVGKLQTISNHVSVEEKPTYQSSGGTKPVDNI